MPRKKASTKKAKQTTSGKPKPTRAPRRPKTSTPVVDEVAAEALEKRVASGGAEATKSLDVPKLGRSDAQGVRSPKPKGPGIVWRDGRVLADGSRRGAGWVRRMTVYLPPELAHQLDMAAVEGGEDRSSIIAQALAAHLKKRR